MNPRLTLAIVAVAYAGGAWLQVFVWWDATGFPFRRIIQYEPQRRGVRGENGDHFAENAEVAEICGGE